jgi:phosphatidylserine decarboxylase
VLPDIFLRNERQLCLLRSPRFGALLQCEVGALCVGKIVQTFRGGLARRGEEKGYFDFGGSSVLLVTDARHVKPDADLLSRTEEGVESLVRLGEALGSAI